MLDYSGIKWYSGGVMGYPVTPVESGYNTRQYPVYLGRLLFGGLEPTGFLVTRLSTNNNLPFCLKAMGPNPNHKEKFMLKTIVKKILPIVASIITFFPYTKRTSLLLDKFISISEGN